MPAVSKAQQHYMGMKYAQAKQSKSGKVSMDGSTMTTKQLRDFAGTKTRGLPQKVKKNR